mgnify:CR=1 FL=1
MLSGVQIKINALRGALVILNASRLTAVMDWWMFALITMFLFSIGNIAMKEIMNTGELAKAYDKKAGVLLPLAVSILVFLAIIYFVFLQDVGITMRTTLLIGGFIVCAGIGFVFLLKAVQTGQIAPVTALVSTSNVTVAILSVVLLKDVLSFQQMPGIGLTFVGMLMLILKF